MDTCVSRDFHRYMGTFACCPSAVLSARSTTWCGCTAEIVRNFGLVVFIVDAVTDNVHATPCWFSARPVTIAEEVDCVVHEDRLTWFITVEFRPFGESCQACVAAMSVCRGRRPRTAAARPSRLQAHSQHGRRDSALAGWLPLPKCRQVCRTAFTCSTVTGTGSTPGGRQQQHRAHARPR